jgi:hypothetical protein
MWGKWWKKIAVFCLQMKHKFFIKFQLGSKPAEVSVGPNSLQELLNQFNQPSNQKTQKQIAMDLYYKEKFAEMELDFLKNAPDVAYQGSWKIFNSDGTIDIDFVPCSVRPEVFYCCYGKN